MTLSAECIAVNQHRTVGNETTYTVPAGKRVIVRDVRLTGRDPAAQALGLWLERSGTQYYLAYAPAFPAYGNINLQDAFIVLDAGDEIKSSSSAGYGFDIWISGHIFDVP